MIRRNSIKVFIPVSVRPNFPKVAPVISELESRDFRVIIAHTKKHRDQEMSNVFFQELNIPQPTYFCEYSADFQNPDMLFNWFMDILDKENPNIVYVHGDTAMVPPAILAGRSKRIFTIHEEAGLRSNAVVTYEERNRRLADHLADFLVAPSTQAQVNLVKEGIQKCRILVAGNPIVDSVQIALKAKLPTPIKDIDTPYILVSVHRPENLERKNRVEQLFTALIEIQNMLNLQILVARHPRMINAIEKYSILLHGNILLLPWLGFIDFIHLLSKAEVFITDSGTSQEEACTTHTPTVTILSQTDRLETVNIGANRLEMNLANLPSLIEQIVSQKPQWNQNPYGDGRASERIADWILNLHSLHGDANGNSNKLKVRELAPYNFSWVIYPWLSASGKPENSEELFWLYAHGVRLVIYLCKEEPPNYQMYSDAQLNVIYIPIPDFEPPAYSQAITAIHEIVNNINNDIPVHVCCRSGVGRTPTVLSMFFVSQGMKPMNAIKKVACQRNGWGYGTSQQRNAIFHFYQCISKENTGLLCKKLH